MTENSLIDPLADDDSLIPEVASVEAKFTVDGSESDREANETVPQENAVAEEASHSEEHVKESETTNVADSTAQTQTRDSSEPLADSTEDRPRAYEPRRQAPSNVLFLPNISSDCFEKDLADFAEKLPCVAKRTFVYMSDSAHHGFVECESVDDATRNLEWINADRHELKGKRVLAEYSKRKNVEDRRTYERRQHARRDPVRGSSRPSRRDNYDYPPRRRSRSRSMPREYRNRSPPSYGRDRYPPREYREDRYRREPPMDSRYPPSRYDAPPQYRPRNDFDEYSRPPPAYHRSAAPYDAPHYRDYPSYPEAADRYAPPRGQSPPSYRQQPPVQAYPPRDPMGYPQPSIASRDPYATYAPEPAQNVGHPLLSLGQHVRPTAVGTHGHHPNPGAYQPYQYK